MSEYSQYLAEVSELQKKYVTSDDWRDEYRKAIFTNGPSDGYGGIISTRLCNVLISVGASTIAEVANLSYDDLRGRCRGFGSVCARELRETLKIANLTLKNDDLEGMDAIALKAECIRLRDLLATK